MSLDRLDQLARALPRLNPALQQQVGETVRGNTAFFEDANTDQLAVGKDSKGQDITPEYAELTIELKQAKGQPTDRVTLRDEGDFYTGILTRLGGKAFELVGTDPKTAKLEEKYGPAIIGLPDAALNEFRADYVKPDLQDRARQVLGI